MSSPGNGAYFVNMCYLNRNEVFSFYLKPSEHYFICNFIFGDFLTDIGKVNEMVIKLKLCILLLTPNF